MSILLDSSKQQVPDLENYLLLQTFVCRHDWQLPPPHGFVTFTFKCLLSQVFVTNPTQETHLETSSLALGNQEHQLRSCPQAQQYSHLYKSEPPALGKRLAPLPFNH